MKRKTIQKVIWVFVTLMVIFSMVIWTAGVFIY